MKIVIKSNSRGREASTASLSEFGRTGSTETSNLLSEPVREKKDEFSGLTLPASQKSNSNLLRTSMTYTTDREVNLNEGYQESEAPLLLFMQYAPEKGKEFHDDVELSAVPKEYIAQENFLFFIVVETFHQRYEQAKGFLLSIAEPRSRTSFVHEYQITQESISSAILHGWTFNALREHCYSFCAPHASINKFLVFMDHCVRSIASLKLVLRVPKIERKESSSVPQATLFKSNRKIKKEVCYFLESTSEPLLNMLLDSGSPSSSYFDSVAQEDTIQLNDGTIKAGFSLGVTHGKAGAAKKVITGQYNLALENLYDFISDSITRNIANFILRPLTVLRSYQREAMESVFTGTRVRSGLIVLPCGAGKSLTGVAISSRISKRTLVVCCNRVSVLQWRDQFLRWSYLRPEQISVLTSTSREAPADVVITTYTMLTFDDTRRNEATKIILTSMLQDAWGLVLFDEVHMAAANNFRNVVNLVKAHCMIGLTATLLREDDKIDDLNYLIGPKLYECSNHELTRKGYIAEVMCVEVLCRFPSLFMSYYLRSESDSDRRKLCNMNPEKIWCCQTILRYHENLQPPDKTLVFSDSVPCLEYCAKLFGRPFLHGETSEIERDSVIQWFKASETVNTLFLSRVGDAALDIPEASVIIQLSSNFGSQRTEVQRLGRILRIKSNTRLAYFYSLVTPDTKEAVFSRKRQRFLLNQGYGYKILFSNDIRSAIQTAGSSPTEVKEINNDAACLGIPQWKVRYDPGGDPISVSPGESLNIEKKYASGKALEDQRSYSMSITKSPLLLHGGIRLGNFFRSHFHEGSCTDDCLSVALRFTLSGERNFSAFCLKHYYVSSVAESKEYKEPRQGKAKLIAPTTKALRHRQKQIDALRKRGSS